MTTSVGESGFSRDVKVRVLVVEDSRQQRQLLARQIANLGYDCECVETCAESREAIRNQTFDCCLVDIGLPDGRGLDLLDGFHEHDPSMVAVMLTGQNDPEMVIESMRGGAFDYLVKPIDFMSLRAGLRRAIAHHDLLCEREALVGLLRDERDQLKVKIDEATRDIRSYAEGCEATNALLHKLVEITQLASTTQSEEALLEKVFEAIRDRVPVVCAAICDLHHHEFSAVVRQPGGELEVFRSKTDTTSGADATFASTESDLLTSYWVRRHTSLDTAGLVSHVYPQSFWNRPLCTVGFYLEAGFKTDEGQREFLGMCAHVLAFECQRSRLMLHAAQHASLGNIALELTRGFLNSLTAVRMASDLVLESDSRDDAREAMAIIQDNVNFLTTQTQQFHELSQIRDDSIETVELSEFIRDTLGLLSASIDSRGIQIATDFRTESECVLLNGSALARTFLDLISCAVRTVENGDTIYIALDAADDERVECSIRHRVARGQIFLGDAGADSASDGISTRDRPAFVLAQRTVQSCGGRLSQDSDADGSNVFRLVLPRTVSDNPANRMSAR